MTDTAKLSELLRRCETATGPDREIDHWFSSFNIVDGFGFYKDREAWIAASIRNNWAAAPVTASIDAALALVERLLPGMDYGLDRDAGRFFMDITSPRDAKQRQRFAGEAETAPLAILCALLKALISNPTDMKDDANG